MKIKDLKAKRALKIQAQQKIVNAAKEENRGLNESETTEFDSLQGEIRNFDGQIERMEQFEENQKRIAITNDPITAPAIITKEEKKPFSLQRAINNAIDKNTQEGAEADAFDAAQNELRSSGLSVPKGFGIAIPADMFVGSQDRDISVLGDSGTKGGKLVASTPSVVMPLLPKLTLESMGVKVQSGLVGDYPLISGDAFSFGYVAENGSVTGTDAAFDGPTMKPKRLSGVVHISNQWLIQTGPGAEANLRALIANGINAALFKGAIAGGGANGPVGLYDTITTNIQAAKNAVPTYADVVNLETLIKSANANDVNLSYLSDPALKGLLKTTKVDAGSGIMCVGQDGQMNGQKYLASSLVDTLNIGADHPLIFGDWAEMTVGFWSGVQMMVDPVTLAHEGKTRLIFNIYNDIGVANEEAFAIQKAFNV